MKNRVDNKLPIGFMDSGLGGISVLREAVRILPEENFIYYGDSKNAPYGEKSAEEIKALTFKAVEKLREIGIKALVVACNTATGAAISDLRTTYPDMPVIGIEPAVRPAVVCGHGGRILVMATPMTIKQRKFLDLLAKYQGEAEIVPVPCPGLMEFVEKGIFDGEVLKKYFDEHLADFLTENTESIVLGCTHYPFLESQIKEYLGNRNISLIDGSRGTSSELKRQLERAGLRKMGEEKGNVTILNSLEDEKMIELSYKLLKLPGGGGLK